MPEIISQDAEARQHALALAVTRAGPGASTNDVLIEAAEFLKFLKGEAVPALELQEAA